MTKANGKKKLADFRPQRRNANKHTPRGIAALDKSMGADGWIGAMTVAADGETFDGSARLETAFTRFPNTEPIIVDSDGRAPIIVRRTDIPNADDPRAKRLGIAANSIASMDYDPDGETLALLAAEDEAIAALLRQDDKALKALEIIGKRPDGWSDGFGGVPTEDRAPFQQITFTLHDSQVEQVKRALSVGGRLGNFSQSANQNSNGNALAFICETFITDHANG